MKLSKIIEILPAVQALSESKLLGRPSFRIGSLINLIKPIVSNYEEQRLKLAREFGKLRDDGKEFEFTTEGMESFKSRLEEMLAEELEIDIPTITVQDIEKISIEPSHISSLINVIIFEEDKK